MPVCDVCGEDTYYEEDGLFFCTVCNTQSQSMVVMELDDTHILKQRPSGVLQEIRAAKQSRKGHSEYNAGRPWTRYEAYQLILQAQADALIAQGAHPSVKEVIQRMYFAYLSKLEVAFVGEDETRLLPKGLERSKHTGWHRELHQGGMDNPEINVKMMKSKAASNQCNSSSADGFQEEESVSSVDGGSCDEDVLPLPLLTSDLSAEEDQDCPQQQQQGQHEEGGCATHNAATSIRLGKQGVLFDVRYMNLRKTLSFLYAACLFASPWITVSDILRWISDGSLPYLETTHLLPADMRLSTFDVHLFRPSLVTSELLRLGTGCLLRLLRVPRVPEYLLKDITVRYTLALDLPESVVPCVVAVMHQCPVECITVLKSEEYHKALPNVDALCAAYILVTLKAIFGLDDHRERLSSDYTKKLQEKVDVCLFDWQTWQWHATRKFLAGSGKVPSALRKEGGDEVDALCQTFDSAQYKDQNYSHGKLYHKLKKAKVATFQLEWRQLLQRSACVLEERWQNRAATADRIKADHRAMSGQDQHPADHHHCSERQQTAQFRNSSISHLLHAQDFVQHHIHQQRSSTTSHHTSLLKGVRKRKASSDSHIEERRARKDRQIDTSDRCSDSADRCGGDSADRCADNEDRCGDSEDRCGGNNDRCGDSDVKCGDSEDRCGGNNDRCGDSDVRCGDSEDRCGGNNDRCGDSDDKSADRDRRDEEVTEDSLPAELRHLQGLWDGASGVRGNYLASSQQWGSDAYSPSAHNWWWREQPSSYQWLLRVLSALVRCPLAHIQRMVCRVEHAMITSLRE